MQDDEASQKEVKFGYMCQTDWNCDLGEALGGTTLYPSVEDLKSERKCVDSCGIVRVKVELDKVVEPGKGWSNDSQG